MRRYQIDPQIAVVLEDANKIHLRSGLWNSQTITLNDDDQEGCLGAIIEAFVDGASIEDAHQITGASVNHIARVVDDLLSNGLLVKLPHGTYAGPDPALLFSAGVMGEIASDVALMNRWKRPVCIYGDEQISSAILRMLKELNNSPDVTLASFQDENWLQLRKAMEKSSSSDPLTMASCARAFQSLVGDALLVACFSRAQVRDIAWINRLALRSNVPWLLVLVDGPMILVGPTFHSPEGPCFNCLEMRVLSNMRDFESYLRTRSLPSKIGTFSSNRFLSPVSVNLASSIAAYEVLNFAAFGANRTFGKVMSVYLPTFEWSVHEVFSLSTCSVCETERGPLRQPFFETDSLSEMMKRGQ